MSSVLSHPKLKVHKMVPPQLGGNRISILYLTIILAGCLQLEHDGPAIWATSNMEGTDPIKHATLVWLKRPKKLLDSIL